MTVHYAVVKPNPLYDNFHNKEVSTVLPYRYVVYTTLTSVII